MTHVEITIPSADNECSEMLSCVYVCVRMCVRACVRACTCLCMECATGHINARTQGLILLKVLRG